eukprot:m.98694 g.98694  ORF g.98694 m.98694 type:complete len:684 (+) comp15561_c0_seq1:98-2149(+)
MAKRLKIAEDPAFDTKCVNTIRVLAADTVQKAKSGHPGAPMGCAPMAYVLWSEFMNYSPENPHWIGRDRFVLSNGHGCTLQYVMLHLTGYNLTIEDLKNFRQVGSKTPGHPENHLTEGVEVSTGPLGQGLSNAVGLAIAEAHMAARFNKPDFKLIDNYTYVICGDGCMQEGVTSEAASLAGHLGLSKLIVLYDDNQIQIDGETSLAFSEDVLKRYEAYGWNTDRVEHGDTDFSAISAAIQRAKQQHDKPTLIAIKTTIGCGASAQGTEKVHGSPLGDEDLKKVKAKFGFKPDEFFAVPSDVAAHFAQYKTIGQKKAAAWDELFGRYKAAHADLAAEFERRAAHRLPENWEAALPSFKPNENNQATRKYSQMVLEKLIAVVPEFFGGSADLTPSTLTKVKANDVDFSKEHPEGNYMRFGVREHAMAAICNGLYAYGSFIPFASTFLNFTGYAMGAVRLSALSHMHVVYIMTHDSIGLGEDGPTHQPVEMLNCLRATPNMLVLRPADGNETVGAYRVALTHKDGPSTLALSRQTCKNLVGSSADKVSHGAYVLQDCSSGKPQVILTATGSEVAIAVEGAEKLTASGVQARVVSFPSWELYNKQSAEYKESVFPTGVPVLSIEAAAITGWERYAHGHMGLTTFGSSGPYENVYKLFNLTPEAVAKNAQTLIAAFKNGAPSLNRLIF